MAVAPGQIPAARMCERVPVSLGGRCDPAVRQSSVRTRCIRCHRRCTTPRSRPPGIDAVYVPLAAADFERLSSTFADSLGVEGASVTIPFKLDALAAATSADSRTRVVGAANTLRRTANGWEATNTDVEGFLAPSAGGLSASLRGARAAVLGAGGAARAVIVASTFGRGNGHAACASPGAGDRGGSGAWCSGWTSGLRRQTAGTSS